MKEAGGHVESHHHDGPGKKESNLKKVLKTPADVKGMVTKAAGLVPGHTEANGIFSAFVELFTGGQGQSSGGGGGHHESGDHGHGGGH